jgi:hypothetical protein
MPSSTSRETGFFKKCDMLNAPVQLTLEGQTAYKTGKGAFLTIVMFSGLLGYSLFVIIREAIEPWIFIEDTQAVPID